MISVTHSTCGVLCTVSWISPFLGGVCAAASTILVVAIAKFRSYDKNRDKKQHARAKARAPGFLHTILTITDCQGSSVYFFY